MFIIIYFPSLSLRKLIYILILYIRTTLICIMDVNQFHFSHLDAKYINIIINSIIITYKYRVK